MGSTRKATVLGVIAASSAEGSPKGTRRNPGVNGPKPSRAVGSVLKPTIVRVRPWKLLAQTITSARSFGNLGEFSDAVVLKKFGDVPEDLGAL
jgi:hypothetical protein